jgi:hypothetical protein
VDNPSGKLLFNRLPWSWSFINTHRFDESEDENNHRIDEHQVRFRGILEIQSLSWLSTDGHRIIEEDLQERDIRMHFHKSNNPVSVLTLAKLYGPGVMGDGLKVRVELQCHKLPTASFCNCM